MTAVHNLAGEEATVSLPASDVSRAADIFADRQYKPPDTGDFEFTLGPYGYRWLRLDGRGT